MIPSTSRFAEYPHLLAVFHGIGDPIDERLHVIEQERVAQICQYPTRGSILPASEVLTSRLARIDAVIKSIPNRSCN